MSLQGLSAKTLRQAFDPLHESLDHGLRLFGDQRVTGIRNDRDSHSRSELVFHLVPLGLRFEGIVRGLQVQQRRRAAGPPFGLFDGGVGITFGDDCGGPAVGLRGLDRRCDEFLFPAQRLLLGERNLGSCFRLFGGYTSLT